MRLPMITAARENRSWFTESIAVGAIPVMAYLLAFGFEYGYYLVYGFPQELIDIDLNRVFMAGIIFLAGVLFVLVETTLVLMLLPSEHPLGPAMARAVTYVLAYLIFLIIFGRLDIFGWIFGVMVAWYLIYKFAGPVLIQRKVPGYLQKFRAHEQMLQTKATLLHAALRTFGATPGNVLVYFLIAFVLSVTFGWYLATERVYYLVVPGPPERVVLRIYGDSIVLARLDRPGRRILREYTVFRRTTGAITLREERIGPLAVER